MDISLEPTGQELVISRELKAPRERVFAAWTDPRQVSVWWTPQDCTLLSCEIDVRPGGIWRRRMRVPDGSVITKHGVYREVAAPGRLVFTYITEYADGSVDPETLVTVMLSDLGNRTLLTLRHSAFRTEASRVSHEGGWTSCLDFFAAYVVSR